MIQPEHTQNNNIIVVSPVYKWVAEYLGATQNFGFKPFVDITNNLIWCNTEYATQELVERGEYTLSTTLTWPDFIPNKFLQRNIELGPATSFIHNNVNAFIKSADTKQFDPIVGNVSSIAQKLVNESNGDTLLIISDVMENIVQEWRCVVVENKCLDVSQYRDADTYHDMSESMWTNRNKGVQNFATSVAQSIHNDPIVPPSYVIDVAVTSNGDYWVIELNPIWCSNPYSLLPEAFIEALSREYVSKDLAWIPDPVLWRRAVKRIPYSR